MSSRLAEIPRFKVWANRDDIYPLVHSSRHMTNLGKSWSNPLGKP